MKKCISVAMVLLMLLSLTTFAGEEFSENAEFDYDYNEIYDENPEQEEETSKRYDDIDTSYDESFDESKNIEYDEEYTEKSTFEYNKTENSGISVYVNNERIDFDVAPILINDRTMVPMRAIFEALGAKVTWDNSAETAIGVLGNTTVKITIGKDYLLKNNDVVALNSPAVVVSDRTLVPVRAIAESLDCTVNWYDRTQVVEIIK